MLCKIACVVAVKYCRSANKTSHFCKKINIVKQTPKYEYENRTLASVR